jgi:hypothetical protein
VVWDFAAIFFLFSLIPLALVVVVYHAARLVRTVAGGLRDL